MKNTIYRIAQTLVLIICHYVPTSFFWAWLIVSLIGGYIFNDLGLDKKCLKILKELGKSAGYAIRK